MNKKILVLFCTLMLMGSLCGCGEKNTLSQENGKTDESRSEEVRTTAQESEQETSAWIPEEFVRYDKDSISYTVPIVHTEANEQCTFLWNVSESELVDWYLGKYGEYDGYKSGSFNNKTGSGCFDSRNCRLTRNDEATSDGADIDIETSGYNESTVSRVSVEITSCNLDKVIADITEVIELMQLGEYTEEILHNEDGVRLDTENNLGYYSASTNYWTNEYEKSYTLILSIWYSDTTYAANVYEYTPLNMEYWQDEYNFSEHFPYSEWDTSSFEAFAADELEYIQKNFDNSIRDTGYSFQSFSYSQTDFGEVKENVKYSYNVERECDSINLCDLCFEYEEKDRRKDMYLDVQCNITYAYDYSFTGRNITDDEIQRLCQARHGLLKKLDSTIQCTLDEMVKLYRKKELNETFDKVYFENEQQEYVISNGFTSLSYGY